MHTIKPLNQADLLKEIELVRAQKRLREQELALCAKDFIDTLNPVSFIKESVHNLVTDPEVTHDLANAGIQLGTNFAIDMVLGRFRSVKGFVGSVLLENVVQPYIKKYAAKLFVNRRRSDQ